MVFMVTIGGLFFWVRSESREDIRLLMAMSREDSRRIGDLILAIKDEIKDFHGRLCKIEEGRNK